MKKIVLILILFLFVDGVRAIDTSASSAILMDTDNNVILYEKNIHNVRSVASISKIMTAVLAIESDKLDDTVVVDDVISSAYGSAIYIQSGEELSLRDLVYGLMLTAVRLNIRQVIIATIHRDGQILKNVMCLLNSKWMKMLLNGLFYLVMQMNIQTK